MVYKIEAYCTHCGNDINEVPDVLFRSKKTAERIASEYIGCIEDAEVNVEKVRRSDYDYLDIWEEK